MRKELFVALGGGLLLVVCCAGTVLLAGAGASLAFAALRSHLAVIVAPLVVAGLVAAALVVSRRHTNGDNPGARLS